MVIAATAPAAQACPGDDGEIVAASAWVSEDVATAAALTAAVARELLLAESAVWAGMTGAGPLNWQGNGAAGAGRTVPV